MTRWVIGDVHGCYHTLQKILNRIGEYDFIYFTGDLCDRGLFTLDVIELIKNNPKMESVSGNHDELMGYNSWMWMPRNGCIQTMQSYPILDNNLRTPFFNEHREWLKERPAFIELDDVVISHSGDINDVWYRGTPKKHENKIHICGHTPVKDVFITEHGVMIDTACVFGQSLTAYNLETKTWIQEPMDERDSMWMDRKPRLSEV